MDLGGATLRGDLLMIPVVALAVAWAWIGEVPTALQLLGAAVIIGSLTLARRARVEASQKAVETF